MENWRSPPKIKSKIVINRPRHRGRRGKQLDDPLRPGREGLDYLDTQYIKIRPTTNTSATLSAGNQQPTTNNQLD